MFWSCVKIVFTSSNTMLKYSHSCFLHSDASNLEQMSDNVVFWKDSKNLVIEAEKMLCVCTIAQRDWHDENSEWCTHKDCSPERPCFISKQGLDCNLVIPQFSMENWKFFLQIGTADCTFLHRHAIPPSSRLLTRSICWRQNVIKPSTFCTALFMVQAHAFCCDTSCCTNEL